MSRFEKFARHTAVDARLHAGGMGNLKLWLSVIAAATLLLSWSLVESGQDRLQRPRQPIEEERVRASGGNYRNLGIEELWSMLQKKDFLLLNVHIPYEGELPQTDAFIPYDQVEKHLDKLPQSRDAKIVLYCMSGRMSAIAGETMVRLGYRNVWNLKEGMREWQKKGFPLLDKRKGGKK